MGNIKYGLFIRFEEVLLKLKASLEKAKDHYKSLFEKLVAGEDISDALIEDASFLEIKTQKHLFQEEQKRLSRIVTGDENAICNLSELHEKLHTRFELDIVAIGAQCIEYHQEIGRYSSLIEKYYKVKSEELKGFFDELYKRTKPSYSYAEEATKTKSKEQQGLLFRAKV